MYAAGVERRVVVKGKNDKNSNKQSGHCGPTLHQRPKWMAARMAVHYVDTWLYVCRYGTERELSIPLSTAIPVLQRTHTSISNYKSLNAYTWHIQQVTTPFDLRIARTNWDSLKLTRCR